MSVRHVLSAFSFFVLVAAGLAPAAAAEDVYQAPESFVAESFGGDPPQPGALWITPELRPAIKDILGHDLNRLRVRYWGRAGRTVWILEEIGKERPITTGLVVDGGKLKRIKVLVYRESHGWEVRYPFFTDQFKGATLGPERGLDRDIDGISGATLSVRALTKLARLALFLHEQTEHGDG